MAIRAQHGALPTLNYHPEGMVLFVSRKSFSLDRLPALGKVVADSVRHSLLSPVHEKLDAEHPETWKWIIHLTWLQEDGKFPSSPAEIRAEWNKRGEKLAEPLRSVFLSLPAGATIWCDRLSQWPTIAWDNRGGRVTLMGDAAHPMTYRKS